jgi:hypothetical protein
MTKQKNLYQTIQLSNISVSVYDPLEIAKAVYEKNLPVGVMGIDVAKLRKWAIQLNVPTGIIFGVKVER